MSKKQLKEFREAMERLRQANDTPEKIRSWCRRESTTNRAN